MDFPITSVEPEQDAPALDVTPLRRILWPSTQDTGAAQTSPTAILLHGFSHCGDIWRPTVSFWRTASQTPTTIAFDLPGHGRSKSLPSGEYNIEAIADSIERELRLLTGQSVILIGHSLGGRIALALSQRRDIRVAGLILVETGILASSSASRGAIVATASAMRTNFKTRVEFVDAVMARIPMAERSAVSEYLHHALQPTGHGYHLPTDPAAVDLLFDEEVDAAWSSLENLRVPLVVIRGAYSSFLSDMTVGHIRERVRVPLSTIVIPKAGHALPLERPDALGQALDHAYQFVTNTSGDGIGAGVGGKAVCDDQSRREA
jgi:pimeloyl-ACP methyl ester carboxylesterase